MRNTDSGRTGEFCSMSAKPKPWAQTTDSPTTIAADSPGVPSAARSSSDNRASTAGLRLPSPRADWADTAADSNSTGAKTSTGRRGSRRRICRVGLAVHETTDG